MNLARILVRDRCAHLIAHARFPLPRQLESAAQFVIDVRKLFLGRAHARMFAVEIRPHDAGEIWHADVEELLRYVDRPPE